jgi:hypothetical protein
MTEKVERRLTTAPVVTTVYIVDEEIDCRVDDRPIEPGMSLADIERRLVAAGLLAEAVAELADRAGDIGLDVAWLRLNGVWDLLDKAIAALRTARVELLIDDD